MMKLHRFFLPLVAALSFGTATVRATTVFIDAGPSSTSQGFSGGNYVAGSEFTISSTLQFNALGYLDAQGDGLEGDHLVGLWDAITQTLIAQATVTSGSTQVLSAEGTGVWYLQSIGSTIALNPGTYRVAGLVGSDADAQALSNDKLSLSGITLPNGYVRTDFPNGGFAFPNLTFPSQAIRSTFGILDTVPVSAPDTGATLALFGIVIFGMGVAKRSMRSGK